MGAKSRKAVLHRSDPRPSSLYRSSPPRNSGYHNDPRPKGQHRSVLHRRALRRSREFR